MKQLSASGAIGLLLTMLIIALLFIMLMPSIKSTGGTSLDTSPIKQESIEDEVNQKLNEKFIRHFSFLYQFRILNNPKFAEQFQILWSLS